MSLTRIQVWAYGAGDLGIGLAYVAINTYFFYFLVNVAGFSPLSAGAVFVAGRVADAFTDPLIGAWSDRVRARLPRMRLLALAAVPTGLAFVGLFALPLVPVAPLAGAFAASVVFSVVYTCAAMPYLAALPELVRAYDARTRVIAVKSGFTMLATLIAFAVPPALVLALSGVDDLTDTRPLDWVAMSAVLATVATLALLLVAWVVPTPPPARASTATPSAHVPQNLLRAVGSAWRTRGMPEAVWMFLAVTIGLMVTNSLLAFFLESVLLLPGSLLPPLLGGLVLVSIVAFPAWVRTADRIGKRRALVIALGLEIVSLLLLVSIVPADGVTWQLLAVVAVNGVAVAGVTLFPWAMLPDLAELDELRTGARREGLLYALFTFGQKLATSVGVFANAIVIAAFGYVAGSVEQSPETVRALRTLMGPVAAGVFAVAAVFAWRFPITREVHAEARRRLAERGS